MLRFAGLVQVPIFCRHYTLPAEDWWTWGPDLEPYFARTFKGADNTLDTCPAHRLHDLQLPQTCGTGDITTVLWRCWLA